MYPTGEIRYIVTDQNMEVPTDVINAYPNSITDKMIENITERHPLKKFLEPQEVADMAAFLISDKSLSVSGQIFTIDCGIVSLKL